MNIKKDLSILALYLPAFHRIPENDIWWGEGFTEWDNVRRAKRLFKGHLQPLNPLDGYYDLSNIDSIRHQSLLMKQFGIDGMIFYHYWFDGKKLLEKPSELLLFNKDIDMPFCFCWANETWSRTWDGKNKEILIEQKYSGEADWKKHIEYLASFFKDSRYLRIDGRPILYFYSASRIHRFTEMISFWNCFLHSIGEESLYVVEFISTFNPALHSCLTDSVIEFEPLYTCRFDISLLEKAKRFVCKKFKIIDFQNYDRLWKLILKRKRVYANSVSIQKSCFVSWDNSPRKRKNSMIVRGSSPTKFYKYFRELLLSNRKDTTNIVVINAWNEWGEGAVLEGTEENRYSFLEAVSKAKKELN